MSDTPRMDALALTYGGSTSDNELGIVYDFARTLERELAEARMDGKRLDWLAMHVFARYWDGTIGRAPYWRMEDRYRHVLQIMRGDTLREAIDAAMEPTK